MTVSVSAVAHGKINLHLGVSAAREDGYHDLETIFQSVALEERVDLQEVPQGEQAKVTVSGRDSHLVPTDPSNLAVRAVSAVQQWYARQTISAVPQVSIHMHKGVPVAGGMAGGSADAAAALVAAIEFYGNQHPETSQLPAPEREEIHRMAAALGADVPFCVLGGTALGTGRGDELVSVMARGHYHWAIATDKRGLSTPKVFAQLDKMRESGRSLSKAGSPDELIRVLHSGDPEDLAPLLVNDLQAPAISLLPSLRETLAAAQEAEALASIVSGSGPTIAMLCRDAEHAVDVATAVSVAGKASSTMTTSSPAGPARIITAHTEGE